ncbi:MAG: hypothetical protein DAHOPDDO_02197 [Ignavibacteriaceae bacterium]|nr:hypothetical protein [Ignavibacteriaceae bacterium]
METFDLTPSPQLLQLLGDLNFKGWQCIAELIDNSIDAIISSQNLGPDQKKIIVKLPTPSKIRNNEPIIIEDFASGMDERQLENAVRAGFSNKSTQSNIGLFGMGFNVATARLANSVEVWTSTKDMNIEIGVSIDLREMVHKKSFIRPKLTRPKSENKKSGTEIKIFNYKGNTEALLKKREIIENLNNAYTERIFNELGIHIIVNDEEIKPIKFCTWSERVSVKVGHDNIPAYQRINVLLNRELFCESCRSWIGKDVETSLNIECPNCQTTGSIIKKEISLKGWVGIQRFADPDHYGIDISRNGRILKKLDKSFFHWMDERAKDDFRFHPEYPRDNELYNGRIVGQVEANFIVPKYTKDDFYTEDHNWILAVKYLRGEMPLQTNLGNAFGYEGLNLSPIGTLFRGYRRIDPPGHKTLMFAKEDGKSDYKRQKSWGQKFYDGDPEFQDEDKWLEEISKELKSTASSFDPFNPTGSDNVETDNSFTRTTTEVRAEKYPGNKILRKTLRIDLESLIDEKPFELTLIDFAPENEINLPVIFEPQGSIGRFNVYLNNQHPMFRDFDDGYEELIFMEVANKYSMMKNNSEEWTITRIYYELKSKYAPETMLSVTNLVTKASSLMREIQNKLISGEGILLPRLPVLSESEEKNLIKRHLDLEGKTINQLKFFLLNTKFLKYMDLNYLFKFIEDFPEIIYDGKILNLPYSELDDDNKQYQLKKYSDYFGDVYWFMNDLAKEGDEATKKLKSQIIRNRLSIEILYGSINK